MKLHIRDGLWLILVVGLGLAWWNDNARMKKAMARAQLEAESAEKRSRRDLVRLHIASQEADVLSEEVRHLRGIVKSSLGDQRTWFELEVKGRSLVAIRPATSKTNLLTLDTVERIEAETGLEAQRLRHFLTPISELQLGRE